MLGALYRCLFLDADDQIAAIEEFDASSVDAAIECAAAMYAARSHHRGFEVWAGSRQLYRTPQCDSHKLVRPK